MQQHLALYREWRPLTFDEVVAQTQVVFPLKQSIIDHNFAHAYLFCGVRGTGKTTLAKIFSRAINCLNPNQGNPCNTCSICQGILDGSLLDVIEMDAASNNSVDNIRRITDEVLFSPVAARYKIYIIDEVHMLSPGAFNALLKTLEEPPAHAIFILATTEPHRIPVTIHSRCQHFDFRRIPNEAIFQRLQEISAKEHIKITPEALHLIVAHAEGALRDAISLLDQAQSGEKDLITDLSIIAMLGLTQNKLLYTVAEAILAKNPLAIFEQIELLYQNGKDFSRFLMELAKYFRDIFIVQVSSQSKELLPLILEEDFNLLQQLSTKVSSQRLIQIIQDLSVLLSDLKTSSNLRTTLEIGLVQIIGTTNAVAASEISPQAVPLTKSTLPPKTETIQPSISVPQNPSTPIPSEPISTSTLDSPADKTEKVLLQEEKKESLHNKQDFSSVWLNILAELKAAGKYSTFLLLNPAQAILKGTILSLTFSNAQLTQYNSLIKYDHLDILKETVHKKLGNQIELKLQLEQEPLDQAAPTQPLRNHPVETENASTQEAWLKKIKQTANTLDITCELEDN